MTFPLVVSFCTKNTPYELEIETLKASCRKFDIEGYFDSLPSRGSWVENCAQKGPFIADCLAKFQKPVLWLDADAEILRYPKLFEEFDYDFAAYKPRHLLSGTLFFSPTTPAIELVKSWSERCVRQPKIWDQRHLDSALSVMCQQITFCNLPQGYCKIFDKPWSPDSDGIEVIVHRQASRRFKSDISLVRWNEAISKTT